MRNISDLRFWRLIFVAVGLVLMSAGMAGAGELDLTVAGSSGSINGAYFSQDDPHSTGSGLIHSFVRMQATGTEQGYNTDWRPVEFDEDNTSTFNHSLLWSVVPVVTIGDVDYREFLLDVNETKPGSLISLDKLEIYLLSTENRHDYSAFGTPVYTMDPASQNNWIKLDYALNSGSGGGDMFAYIPNSLFTGTNQYVYLFSRFGDNFSTSDGFEEWAWREPIIPEPASLLALSTGLVGLLGLCYRGSARRKAGKTPLS
ncbi:MAG TPA: hypothetical protein VMX94_02560 [Armatimonadota bacterium]|nr:hypothetical protein [Armatimonadota bacterium]